MAAPSSVADEDAWVPFTSVERAMARPVERTTSVPLATAHTYVDIRAALAAVQQLRGAGVPVTFTTMLVAATAHALQRFPALAADIDYGEWRRRTPDAANVGVAVAAPCGLVVPVVRRPVELPCRSLRARSTGSWAQPATGS